MYNKDVFLNNLTDKQKTLLSQISYIDIDLVKYSQLKSSNRNITISDLESILLNSEEYYVGSPEKIVSSTVGTLPTGKELLQELEKEGLGDLKITDIEQNTKTGFSGIAFQDSNKDTGISYSGTDMNTFISDCITNAQEYITNTSPQAENAKQFYNKNQNNNGKNYLYGHSLGGNLVEHVYLENHENVGYAFTINAYPISQELLNTGDKINAFNDSRKFQCNVIGGDWVSELRDTDKYSNNINYIENNNSLKDNIISDHLPDMATYNKDGNFITKSTKLEAYKDHEHNIQRTLPKGLSLVGDFVKLMYTNCKNAINTITSPIKNMLNKSSNKMLPESKNKSTFKKNLNLMQWANQHDNYTLEDAENAIKISDNPFQYFTPQFQGQTNINDKSIDIEEDNWHSHDHLYH